MSATTTSDNRSNVVWSCLHWWLLCLHTTLSIASTPSLSYGLVCCSNPLLSCGLVSRSDLSAVVRPCTPRRLLSLLWSCLPRRSLHPPTALSATAVACLLCNLIRCGNPSAGLQPRWSRQPLYCPVTLYAIAVALLLYGLFRYVGCSSAVRPSLPQ